MREAAGGGGGRGWGRRWDVGLGGERKADGGDGGGERGVGGRWPWRSGAEWCGADKQWIGKTIYPRLDSHTLTLTLLRLFINM
jgi:hypothetical protein